MEKVIKLVMNVEKAIKIFVNDKELHSIDAKDRSIKADKIYEIIGFATGNHYTVESENETGVDTQVIDFFVDMFREIINEVNLIDADSKEPETEIVAP